MNQAALAMLTALVCAAVAWSTLKTYRVMVEKHPLTSPWWAAFCVSCMLHMSVFAPFDVAGTSPVLIVLFSVACRALFRVCANV